MSVVEIVGTKRLIGILLLIICKRLRNRLHHFKRGMMSQIRFRVSIKSKFKT